MKSAHWSPFLSASERALSSGGVGAASCLPAGFLLLLAHLLEKNVFVDGCRSTDKEHDENIRSCAAVSL